MPSSVPQMHKKLNRDVASDEWCTPKDLARVLGTFDLDPCSNNRSHIQAKEKYGLEWHTDGLTSVWKGCVFVNPPYSNVMPWAQRLAEHDGPWCALVKLDPTTKWWAYLVTCKSLWAPFICRLKFERQDKPPLTANFPSALIWRHWVPSFPLITWLWEPNSEP